MTARLVAKAQLWTQIQKSKHCFCYAYDVGIPDRSDRTALMRIISECFEETRLEKITFMEKNKRFF